MHLLPCISQCNHHDDETGGTNDDAYDTARELAHREGILGGISSGANVWATLKVAEKLGQGRTVVTVICDTAERYLSTPLIKD